MLDLPAREQIGEKLPTKGNISEWQREWQQGFDLGLYTYVANVAKDSYKRLKRETEVYRQLFRRFIGKQRQNGNSGNKWRLTRENDVATPVAGKKDGNQWTTAKYKFKRR